MRTPLLAAVVLLASLAAARPAAAQSDPASTAAWLRGSGTAAIVAGSVASLVGGGATAYALTLGPQPQPPSLIGATLAWSLATHALSVGMTVYGGVLLARAARLRHALPAVAVLPYAEPRGGGFVLAVQF